MDGVMLFYTILHTQSKRINKLFCVRTLSSRGLNAHTMTKQNQINVAYNSNVFFWRGEIII